MRKKGHELVLNSLFRKEEMKSFLDLTFSVGVSYNVSEFCIVNEIENRRTKTTSFCVKDNPCIVSCRSLHNKTLTLQTNSFVTDGTSCMPGTNNLCINGECLVRQAALVEISAFLS
jgi:hypothetical protein